MGGGGDAQGGDAGGDDVGAGPGAVAGSVTTSTSHQYEDLEKVPWRQGHTHHKTKHRPPPPSPSSPSPPPPQPRPPERDPTERAGPYFRPPSAISHKYKNFRVEPGQPLDEIDPECWPHCRNATRGSKRKRKHSSNKKRKYYNYKLLYDTLKVSGEGRHSVSQ